MPVLFFKLIPLLVSCGLLAFAFRIHERFWSLGFSGWKKMYLGLAAIFLGSLGGIFFEFAELREWQVSVGWPIDWAFLGVFAALGAGLLLWGSVERLSLAAREKESLDERREAFELFDSIRDAAQGPYSFLEVLNFSLKEIIRKIDADAGGLWLLHPSGNDYILASASGFALPLQQKLERMPVVHAGFGRIIEAGSAREISNPESLQQWFPELCGRVDSYGSLIGVPLFGGLGAGKRRETLGLLIMCSRGRASLGPSDIKLIGSAVAFLASVIAEVKTARLMRSQKSAFERLQARERELTDWINVWSDKKEPRRRLQAAVASLADQVGDFVGCGRYVDDGNRWEPLALAGGGGGPEILGHPAFRRAAGEALRGGSPVIHDLPSGQNAPGKTTAYRMVPVSGPDPHGSSSAVLFIPLAPDPPWWYEPAIEMLVELVRVALIAEKPAVQKIALSIPQPKLRPDYDWAGLGRLMPRALREKPENLPGLLSEMLPPGWRLAVWQAVPEKRREYHLRMACGREVETVYHPPDELVSSSPAGEAEYNAYLGGIVRLNSPIANGLADLWPDFKAGWRGERFPAVHLPKNWGWTTCYQKAEAPEAADEALNFLQSLAGMIEIVLARHDRSAVHSDQVPGVLLSAGPAADESGGNGDIPYSAGVSGPDESDPGRAPLDRAIAQWIVAQPDRVRLGRFAFDSAPTSTPIIATQIVHDILSWGAGHLKNGLPATEYLTVSARGEGGRVSIVFERSDFSDQRSENGSGQPVSVAPVSDRLRLTLDSWNARIRVINSPTGPRKFILSFDAAAEGEPVKSAVGKVLIIDEQEFLRDLLLGMLEILGFTAAATASAEEGLRLFSAGGYTVVVSGQTFSEMTAGELARRIKQFDSRTRFIVVKELGYSDPPQAGGELIDHVLPKPFRIEDLRLALAELPIPAAS